MKKLFVVLIALAMLLSMVAFAEAPDLAGTWYLNEVGMDGVTMSPAALGAEMYMELNEDGTASATSVQGGESETQEGTWAVDGDAVTVTLDEQDQTFVIQDGNLVADDGGMTMTFGREKAEAETFEPAEPKADASEADYAGNWSAFQINLDGTYLDAALLGEEITASIEGTTITLNGFLFDGEAFETAFADGALSFIAEDPDSVLFAGVTAQLLEDDTLALTLSASGDMILIMSRVEG